MFRKLILASLALVTLGTVAVLPIEAHEFRAPRRAFWHTHYRPYAHRVFYNWAAADAWMAAQRRCGFECYFEWHGPQCFVYYR
jgi:hypothetical protein